MRIHGLEERPTPFLVTLSFSTHLATFRLSVREQVRGRIRYILLIFAVDKAMRRTNVLFLVAITIRGTAATRYAPPGISPTLDGSTSYSRPTLSDAMGRRRRTKSPLSIDQQLVAVFGDGRLSAADQTIGSCVRRQ